MRSPREISKKRRIALESLEDRRCPASFTPGNVTVYRVGTGTTPNSASTPVFIDEFAPPAGGGTSWNLVQSVALPTASSGANARLTAAGTNFTEGLLTRSVDGSLLALTGYDAAVGVNSIATSTSASVPRVVGLVGIDGSIDTTTALNDFATGGSPRSVATVDGSDLWVSGDISGVRYTQRGGGISTQLSSTGTNLRQAQIAGGQLYVSSGAGTLRVATVGSGLPKTGGQTIANLPSFPTTGSPYAFQLVDLSPAVPGVDTLYIADDQQGLLKYSLVSGSWLSSGKVGVDTDDYRGIAVSVVGTQVTIYATRSTNQLVSLVDSSGYNGTLTGAPTLIATAAANTFFRGVALAPDAAPTDIALASSSGLSTQTFSTSLSTTDASSSDGFTYQLVSGTGDDQNASFSVVGSTLQSTGVLSAGSYSVRIRTTDKGALSFERALTIVISAPPNQAPSAADVPVSTNEDIAVSGMLSGSDPDNDPLTYSRVTEPAHGSISSFNATTGAFTYTPSANFSGSDSFQYRVSDGSLQSSVAMVTLSIAAVNDPGVASISGIATEDQTLTASVADVDGISGRISYQWQLLDGGNWVSIPGANQPTYTLTDLEVGTMVRVTATYVDDQGFSENPTSTSTSTVTAVNDPGSLYIAGAAEEEQSLQAIVSDDDGLSQPIAYQWQQQVGGTWQNIVGATGGEFWLDDPQVGGYFRVLASYTDDQGFTENLTSSAVGPVSAVNDVGSVTISGQATEDQTLTAQIWDVDGLTPNRFYQWYRDDGFTRTPVSTAPTYTLGDADVGNMIIVVASYGDAQGFSQTVESDAVGPVANINDAPTLNPASTPSFGAMLEDAASTSIGGVLVSSLLTGYAADADGDALGIAAVALGNPAKGAYQYKLAGATNWAAMPNVAETSALLLPGDASLRFVPKANVNGTVKLYFRAWDGTAGTAGSLFDLTGRRGGTGTASLTFAVASASIMPVNDAPTLSSAGTLSFGTTTEDNPSPTSILVSSLFSGRASDVDGDPLGVAVVALGNPGKGQYQFQLSGGSWTTISSASETSATLLPVDARMRFLPNPDFNGTVSLYFRAWDGTQGSAGNKLDVTNQRGGAGCVSAAYATATYTVSPVNDAPVLAASLANPVGYTHGTAPILFMGANSTVTDVDSPNFRNGQLKVTGIGAGDVIALSGRFYFSGADVLYTPDGQPAVVLGTRNAGGGSGTDLTITFTSTQATLDLVTRLIRNLRFSTTGPSGGRSLAVQVSDDQQAWSNTVARTINVA